MDCRRPIGLLAATSVAAALVLRCSASTDPPRGSPLDGDAGVTAVVATPDAVWVLRSDSRLTRVNPIGGSITSFEIGGHSSALSGGASGVWVADQQAGTIRRVDPTTGVASAPISTGGHPIDLAAASDGSIWVSISGP